jgi:hypothetical protein
MGAAPRPPPAWLNRLGWLPWARCCGPGVPLVTLSCLSAAARVAGHRGGKGTLGALSMLTMTAAAAEAAGAILAEARAAAQLRVAHGASLAPVLAALAYCGAGALCLGSCVGTPALRELRRALALARDALADAERRQRSRAAGAAGSGAAAEGDAPQPLSPLSDGGDAPHPLGEPLWRCGADGRPITRALAARLEAAAAAADT